MSILGKVARRSKKRDAMLHVGTNVHFHHAIDCEPFANATIADIDSKHRILKFDSLPADVKVGDIVVVRSE